MRIVIMSFGSNKPIEKKDLMKSLVKLVESQNKIMKAHEDIHEKKEYFENLKLTDEIENLKVEDEKLFHSFASNARRESMLVDMAASKNRNFNLN